MSKAERKTDKITDAKMAVFERDGWQCVYVDSVGRRCEKQATQAAHVLPQDVLHLSRYGPAVIHHVENMRGTCPKHNAAVQINYRSRPRDADEQARRVREIIEEENER